jgi:DNA polymerase III subunit alpha
MSFVHLHNHSHYSLLDGLAKLDDLISKAKEQGCPALAITDHGVLYGAIEFYKKCKKAGIKPIIGIESYLAPGSRLDKNTKDDAKNFHLVLWAKNNEGYQNLIKLSSLAHLEGFYYKPRLDWDLLEKYHHGLIASSACLAGEIPFLIRAGELEQARKRILDYNNLFGEGNFYLELMDHPELEDQDRVNKQLIKFSRELGIPLVATNDVHYIEKEDGMAQDILLCLQNKKKIEDESRMKMPGDYSFRSTDEMTESFKDVPDAIENTLKIAEKCNIDINLDEVHLPYFEVPEGHDQTSYLREWCERGIEKRFPKAGKEYLEKVKKRLDYELDVINNMGWPSYFLIVADLVEWSRKNKIIVGPGRGSAAGSIVCYLTGITGLDPIEYDLLFERFLNPDRISMPDIDLDFADTRRDEVIRYTEDKYGHDCVAQIITFGTMAARAAIRDVGRVLDEPYDYCDKLAKMIPMNFKIKEAIKNLPEVRDMYEKDPSAKRILDFSEKLEGVSRHASTHACGVLITKEPLTNYVPLQHASSSGKEKSVVSQYYLHSIDDLGLLKVDFLGLKNLTVIEAAINIIKNTRGVEIDIDKISLEDKKTFNLFKKGDTIGVFQFESGGMKRYLKQLEPNRFEDIVAMVALYRPGPMEWIPDFIKGKKGLKKTAYLHPKLEPILEKTYGVAVYQEQVMRIASELAGLSKGETDTLRKAMGKKIPELLEEQKEKFVSGCVKNSLSESLARKIFSFIEPFAGYGFNRSHAACYALIGYQTAYLKAHYPAEFMAALLSADQNDIDRISIEMEECRKMGIQIAPPDINESFASFTVLSGGKNLAPAKGKINTIRFGLNAVKNVGSHIVEEVIKERKENGSYKNIFDFLERVVDKDLNKKSLESLIKCGAFDQMEKRENLLENIDLLLSFNKEKSKSKNSSQLSLFLGSENSIVFNYPDLNGHQKIRPEEKLRWEKELLGLYVSEHPFDVFRDKLKKDIISISNLGEFKNKSVLSAGVISSIKKIVTRKNENMLFVKIEDGVSFVELLVFPKILKESLDVWGPGKSVLLKAVVSDKDGDIKLLVNKVEVLNIDNLRRTLSSFKDSNGGNDFRAQKKSSSLGLIFKKGVKNDDFSKVKDILDKYPGDDFLYFKVELPDGEKLVKSDLKIKNCEELRSNLKKEFKSILDIA